MIPENKMSVDKNMNHIGSWSKERRNTLTKQIAYLSIAITLFYLVFDYLSGNYDYLPYYLILLFGSLLSIGLLRFKRHTLAKVSLMLSGLLVLSIFSAWETTQTGVFMYFLVVAVASLTLFGAEEMLSALLIGTLNIGVFYVVNFSDWIYFEPLELTQDYIDSSLMINFCISLVALMTMVYHVLSISARYEIKMNKSQEELITLTNELTESRNRFELAIKGSSAGIWDWNIIEDELYISPLLALMLGYEGDKYLDLNYQRFINILDPSEVEVFNKKLDAHLYKGEPFSLELKLRKVGNQYIWVLLTGQAEWDENGKPMRMVGTVLDIDDRQHAFKKVNEQNKLLAKTNDELDKFVYSTSHDLRAPLSSILGLVKIAELSNDPNELAKCMRMIEKSIHTLNGFISDIIDYSRNTRLGLDMEKFQLKELIDGVIEGLRYFEKSETIDFKVNLSDDIEIVSDLVRLKIVLNNLISNAIKYHNYSQAHPTIVIDFEEGNDSVTIKITDNGTGIDPKLKDRIFDMFFRATEKSEGSGLGLYIAKEMITKLSGQLTCKSEQGKGTTFIIEIPKNEALPTADA
ncbi:MAG TPA: ATP-binding protein [Fulvivirga sp.]|nr:ATP-binding protein [Fulvivirga sp.]